MSKISTDALLNKRAQKKEKIDELEILILKSENKIGELEEQISDIEQQVVNNVKGVLSIEFED